MMEDLAKALTKLTWEEMDAFASRIVEVATDDLGEPNDERYIAQVLLDFASDILAERAVPGGDA